ncbi:21.7 kDa class VI heat shock protein [Carica papaya]|uniref:21.7 kDa class VI heat shock protein n=1 Tax=Carica papaya TaxID=3649 RepID=UPI000B8CD6B2|nr:21.7 kDa class VI heat shock protein [Carica papaya]
MTSNTIKLEIHTNDKTPQKWSVALTEDVFRKFLAQGSPAVHKVFGDGSLFSPFLFGKYFDPSDAFPLWEFESDILLSSLRSSGHCSVDWFQTDQAYVLKAQLPGSGKSNVQIYVDNWKVMEISGEWKQQRENKTKDWRSGKWWENGYVRRLELPEDADCKKMEVYLYNDIFLEIRIPKNSNLVSDTQASDAAGKNSELM